MILGRRLIGSCAVCVALAGCSDAPDEAGPSSDDGSLSSGGSENAGGSMPSTVGGSPAAGGNLAGTGGIPNSGSGGASAGGPSGGADSNGSGGQGDGAGGGPSPTVDVFGIPILKPSKVPGYEWNSLHWATGEPRSVSGRDPSDPTGVSIQRGNTSLMEIDGAGVLSMGGPQPRLYFQPPSGESEPFFRDIEFTGYYRRTAEDGASNAGFSVGVRAHLNGHGSADHCLASTYGLVFRNSGSWVFYKELDHPDSSTRQGGQVFLDGGAIAVGEWIGMKMLVHNLPGDTAVKLEAYVDTDSGGEETSPEDWRKLGETIDNGDWNVSVADDCGYPNNAVITQGGGVAFIRNTDVSKVQYKSVSWREIVDE